VFQHSVNRASCHDGCCVGGVQCFHSLLQKAPRRIGNLGGGDPDARIKSFDWGVRCMISLWPYGQ
jgi:hypothetical protein